MNKNNKILSFVLFERYVVIPTDNIRLIIGLRTGQVYKSALINSRNCVFPGFELLINAPLFITNHSRLVLMVIVTRSLRSVRFSCIFI